MYYLLTVCNLDTIFGMTMTRHKCSIARILIIKNVYKLTVGHIDNILARGAYHIMSTIPLPIQVKL